MKNSWIVFNRFAVPAAVIAGAVFLVMATRVGVSAAYSAWSVLWYVCLATGAAYWAMATASILCIATFEIWSDLRSMIRSVLPQEWPMLAITVFFDLTMAVLGPVGVWLTRDEKSETHAPRSAG